MKQRIIYGTLVFSAIVLVYTLWSGRKEVADLNTKVTQHGQQLADYSQYKADDNARHLRLAGDVKSLDENLGIERESRGLKEEAAASEMAAERKRLDGLKQDIEDSGLGDLAKQERVNRDGKFKVASREDVKKNADDIKDSGVGALAKKVRDKKDSKFMVASLEDVERNKPVAIDTSDFVSKKKDWDPDQAQRKLDREALGRAETLFTDANRKIGSYQPSPAKEDRPPEKRWDPRRSEHTGGGGVRQWIRDRDAFAYIPNQPQNPYPPTQPEYYGYLTTSGKPETELQALFYVRERVWNDYWKCWQMGPEKPVWREVIRNGDKVKLPKLPGYTEDEIDFTGFPLPSEAIKMIVPPPAPRSAPSGTPSKVASRENSN